MRLEGGGQYSYLAEKKERGDVSEKKWSEKWILPKFNHEEENVEASDVCVCV